MAAVNDKKNREEQDHPLKVKPPAGDLRGGDTR